MIGNELGGRKEATGVWAWKLETLQPGVQTVITYSLDNVEKGDWNETDVFYRGSQEVIGATKMDEKLLDEIRRQEEAFIEQENLSKEIVTDSIEEEQSPPLQEEVATLDEPPVERKDTPVVDSGETKQTTLFGGDY